MFQVTHLQSLHVPAIRHMRGRTTILLPEVEVTCEQMLNAKDDFDLVYVVIIPGVDDVVKLAVQKRVQRSTICRTSGHTRPFPFACAACLDGVTGLDIDLGASSSLVVRRRLCRPCSRQMSYSVPRKHSPGSQNIKCRYERLLS